MATYGSTRFQDQSVRAYIKSAYCKATDEECSMALHPPKFDGAPGDKFCDQCESYYKHRYAEIRVAMERVLTDTVNRLIKTSCHIGACKTSSYDCGVCGDRARNIKNTTKIYFEIQKKACDAYLFRTYGVPRNSDALQPENLKTSGLDFKYADRGAFYANWRPFVSRDGKFECNYPAIFLKMTKENAEELASIIFSYDVKPREEAGRPNMAKRFSTVFGSTSTDGDIYGEGRSVRSSSRASSGLSAKSVELFRKGSERVKAITPLVSGFVQKEKDRLEKIEVAAKDKYSSLKGKF